MTNFAAHAGAKNSDDTEEQDAADYAARVFNLFLRRWQPLLFIAAPTIGAALYYSVIAAPLYVSESDFIVRLVSPAPSNNFASLLQSSGLTRSQDDTFSVQDFLESRDSLRALDSKISLRKLYARPESDWLSRFPRFWESSTFEGLFRYFGLRVQLVHNATTGITTLRTTAFRSRDAKTVNETLLTLARDFLKRLNDRAREDTVTFANHEVSVAESRVINTQAAVTDFRNKELMIDPKQTSTAMLDLIDRLSGELAMARTRQRELMTSAPQSVEIASLDSRTAALERQIDDERSKIVGQDASVAPRIAEYEQLTLARDFAEKALTSASTALDTAQAEARRQQLYLEMIVEPNQPDEAEEPQSLRNIFVTFIAATGLFLMYRLLTTAVRDYASS